LYKRLLKRRVNKLYGVPVVKEEAPFRGFFFLVNNVYLEASSNPNELQEYNLKPSFGYVPNVQTNVRI
jgi:hypothetical protein